jgi:ferrous iron transport protein A
MDHAESMKFLRLLSELSRGEGAIVARVEHIGDDDVVADRLEALGIVPGEPVRIVATGPFGGEPRVVLVGSTRFALRRAEAARVAVRERQDQDARDE